jgi:hypothetical protein
MQADLPRLDAALEGLERHFLQQGAPVGRQLRAGLSDGGLLSPLHQAVEEYHRWVDGPNFFEYQPTWFPPTASTAGLPAIERRRCEPIT